MPHAALAFQSAVEARDFGALAATLSDRIAFHTPIRFTPFVGKEEVLFAMQLAADAFAFQDGFRYTADLRGGNRAALFFEAVVAGKTLHGVDYLELDDDGLVEHLAVMMRPYSGVQQVVTTTAKALSAAGLA